MSKNQALARKVTFLASFPLIQSAIRVCGDGGMRLQLDVPESELAEAIEVVAWRGKILRVVIEPVERSDESTKIHKNPLF